MNEEKDLGKVELKPADYCAVIFVLFALIFLIGRSFYTGCNQEEIKNIKKKSKSLINEGLRRATFAELPDVFNENKGESEFGKRSSRKISKQVTIVVKDIDGAPELL